MNPVTESSKAIDAINNLVKYIYDNDKSYERNLEQRHRAFEIIDNLERYAIAIQERKQKVAEELR